MVTGPTAVGKTSLAIQLAKHYATVIVSADSRQIYKEMSIGTAKPSKEDLKQAKHYFIGHKSVHELYGAGHFAKEAQELIIELFKEHDKILLVGGSGLYIKALLDGIDAFEDIPMLVRETLNLEFKTHGLAWLQNELEKADPLYFEKVDKNNSQRIIRALEIYRHTGKTYSSFLQKEKRSSLFNSIHLFINMPRSELYQNINNRVDKMMNNGLLEEVKSILLYKDLNALNTVGYKELFEHLNGQISLEKAIEKIKQHTRNYAKRQITWFKNQGNYEEFMPNDFDKICAYIDIIIENE